MKYKNLKLSTLKNADDSSYNCKYCTSENCHPETCSCSCHN